MTITELIKKLSALPDPDERVVCVCLPGYPYVNIIDAIEDEPSPGVALVMLDEKELSKNINEF